MSVYSMCEAAEARAGACAVCAQGLHCRDLEQVSQNREAGLSLHTPHVGTSSAAAAGTES